MIKIAIADDEAENIRHIENVLREYSEKRGVEIQIESYENSSFLKQDILEGKGADIYLLDVEMPEFTGFDIARTIRSTYYEAFIIFITNHNEYAADGYEVSAFRYIMKERINEKLPEAFDYIIPELERMKAHYYVIDRPQGNILICHTDIIKIEKESQKYSIIFSRAGEHRVRSSLTNILKVLDSDSFIFVNKGVIVNLSHVNGIDDRNMELTKDYNVEVSRSRIREVKQAVSEYYRRKR